MSVNISDVMALLEYRDECKDRLEEAVGALRRAEEDLKAKCPHPAVVSKSYTHRDEYDTPIEREHWDECAICKTKLNFEITR